MKYYSLVFSLLLTIVAFSQATQKYTIEYEGFFRGEELFNKRELSSAKYEFDLFIERLKNSNDPLYLKARYYSGLCALGLNHDDEAVRLFMQFNKDYPENIYKNEIFLKLGNYYFKIQNKSAKEWYSKVIASNLLNEQKDEFHFKSGYTYLMLKDSAKAKATFVNSKESKNEYGYASKYYFAVLLFASNSKSMEAYEHFNDLGEDGQYLGQVYNYMIQIKHQNGNYYDCVAIFSKDDKKKHLTYDNVYLIGDAHYQLKEYRNSIPYFEEYDSTLNVLKLRTSNREFNYAFGNSYYQTGNLEKAIGRFNLAITKQDSLSQIIYYQIADIFKQQYSKNQDVSKLINARTAFEKAASLNFDLILQEDALYNAAVLAFNVDDSPYNESVQIFEKFLKKFPNSSRKNEIYQFLVEVYRRTNNYELALSTIEGIDKKDFKLKSIYQSVAYNYAVTLFQKNEYQNAIAKFKLVEKYPEDLKLKSQSKFWIAESILRQFEALPRKSMKDSLLLESALEAYKMYLQDPSGSPANMRHEAYYQMGYIHLKQQNLTDAIEKFRIFVTSGSTDIQKLLDAYLRIADSYYMMRKDEDAIKYYLNAYNLKSGSEDLALFYMSKSHGFLEQNDKKIDYLLKLINDYKKSKYLCEGLYNLALAYKDDKADYSNALNYFNKILNEYPKASFYLDCKIEVADIHFLKNDYDKAENEYQKILDANLNNNSICLKAATGLKNVYSARGETDKIAGLITNYPCAQISTDEIENLYYEPAEKSYTDSLFVEAISKFENYLSKFPEGRFSSEAMYFLGDCYGRNANNLKKIEIYKQLVSLPVNSFTEGAAAFLSQQLYNSGEYEDALTYYLELEKVSSKANTLYAGRLGAMRTSFLLQKYDTSAIYSKLILESGNLSNSIKVEAEYSKGISNFKLANYAEAIPSLTWISKNTTTSWASEAQFVIAEIYYLQGDYPKSDSEARVVVKMKPSYNFWVAKALILQSRICIAQNNLFQAEQTINSVLDHYPDKDDGIIDEANSVKEEIEQLKNGGN
jgi:tetratricopeptide (TPR) repeat protein